MKIKQLICIIILLVMPVLVSAESGFSKMYVFGDSLSDTGNLATLAISQIPDYIPQPNPGVSPAPYYEFRASNGPVAVEELGRLLGLDARAFLQVDAYGIPGSNYAFAGARARDKHESPEDIDLMDQVFNFIALHSSVGAPSDALYVIMIGGNDVRDARDDEENANEIIEEAVAYIADALETLHGAGANTFYVINSPNIGLIPDTTINGDKKFVKNATKLSKRFSKKLKKGVHEFEKNNIDSLNVMLFDLFKFSNTVHRNSIALGLENNTDACFSLDDVNLIELYLTPTILNPFGDGDICLPSFEPIVDYAFFDEIHPTAFVHKRIGQAMFSLVPALE